MLRSVIVAACVVALAGCGDPGNDGGTTSPTSENGPLAQVGALYRDHWELKKKAPTGYKDFAPYAEIMPEGFNALRTGDVVAIWGVRLEDLSPEATGDSADEVLAYQKETPESGGYVLMKNRKIRQMTADEFKAAPKAPGTTEDASKSAKKK
jgi:hypothetical protein